MKANWIVLVGAVLIALGGLTRHQYQGGIPLSCPPSSDVLVAAALLLIMLSPRRWVRGVLWIGVSITGSLWAILVAILVTIPSALVRSSHAGPTRLIAKRQLGQVQ